MPADRLRTRLRDKLHDGPLDFTDLVVVLVAAVVVIALVGYGAIATLRQTQNTTAVTPMAPLPSETPAPSASVTADATGAIPASGVRVAVAASSTA